MTRPGSTDLTSYYIYDQPVLAPADGTVTYVLDGTPTSRLDRLTSATLQEISW
jgi:hypothetical protein